MPNAFSPAAVRILPFAAYLVFIALLNGLSWVGETAPQWKDWVALAELWHYPIKILVVSAFLGAFWSQYDELRDRVFQPIGDLVLACVVGVVVYLAWVRMDWPWATMGTAQGYNPFAAGQAGVSLAAVRLFGASVVVPVMEELFWRSFLLRYLINPEFKSVAIGAFTPMSCLVTIVMFGFEHYLWLAGMVAGLAYTLLCYRTRRIWPCIIAHGVTNFCLGVHVLVTGEWQWW